MEPFDPAVTKQVAGLYFEAERQIVQAISARLQAGAQAKDWRMNALKDAQVLSAPLRDQMAKMGMAEFWTETAGQAYLGSPANAALLNLTGGKVPSIQALTAVRSVATELADTMNAVNRAILRRADDTYARIIGKVVGENLAGEAYITRAKAAQRAMDLFTQDGVGKFADRNGRQWRLGDYVDMATRTGLHRAQLGGHEAALDAARLDLVVVQPGPRPCPICDKWARAVLTRSGETGTLTVTNEATGNPIKVRVDATLNDARGAGFQHPNCRCSIRAFIPGVTTKKELERPPYDEAEYKAQQAQRGLENKLRTAKMREAGAVDPAVKARARTDVRAAKADLDDHLYNHDYLKRRTDRQGIGPKGRFRPGQGGLAPDIKTPPRGTIWDTPLSTPRPTLRPNPVTKPKPTPKPKVAPAPKVDPVSQRPAITPLLDGKDGPMPTKFSRLATSETFDEIATKTNGSRSDWSHDYRSNCTYVVNAVEFRARGYDVVARRTIMGTGRADREYLKDWEGDREFTRGQTWLRDKGPTGQAILKDKGEVGMLEDMASEFPDGARGYVAGEWKDQDGAHIFNWVKKDGHLEFHEGQVVSVTSAVARTNVTRMKANSLRIMRTDDLTPKASLLETLQPSGNLLLDDVAKFTEDAAWAKERAARFTAEAKALEAKFMAEYGDAWGAWLHAKIPHRTAIDAAKLPRGVTVTDIQEAHAARYKMNLDEELKRAKDWRATARDADKALIHMKAEAAKPAMDVDAVMDMINNWGTNNQ